MIDSDILFLPHHKGFEETLGWNLPIGSPPNCNYIVRADGSGILQPATAKETREYLDGGEYDERLKECKDSDSFEEIVIDVYL